MISVVRGAACSVSLLPDSLATSHLQLFLIGPALKSRDMSAATCLRTFASPSAVIAFHDMREDSCGILTTSRLLATRFRYSQPCLEIERTRASLLLSNGDFCTARCTMSHREDQSGAHLGWSYHRDEG